MEQKNFCKPLAEGKRRNGDESMRMYSENPRQMENELKQRPIRNCFWEKKCVPVPIYDLISTDILHEFVHGLVLYVLNSLRFGIARGQWDESILKDFGEQMKKCSFFSAPGYVQVRNPDETHNRVEIIPERVLTVRKLDVFLDSKKELKLKTGTSIISWIYMSTIALGYGTTACLSKLGNDLHHFRIAMNCMYKLMILLETEELEVTDEWESEVHDLVDAMLLVLEDPHVYNSKKGEPRRTEKMHRMLHLVENFKEHGCFKVTNTFHWERCHSYFTKKVYNAVGRQARKSESGGPHLRMIVQVYMDQLLSTMKDSHNEVESMEDDDTLNNDKAFQLAKKMHESMDDEAFKLTMEVHTSMKDKDIYPGDSKNEEPIELAKKMQEMAMHGNFACDLDYCEDHEQGELNQEENQLARKLKAYDNRRAAEEKATLQLEKMALEESKYLGESLETRFTPNYVGDKSSILIGPLCKGNLRS